MGRSKLVPQCRFPEFKNENWARHALGKVFVEVSRPVDMQDEQNYSLVTVKRRYGGVVSRGIFKGEKIKVKTQFLIQENDFLISKRQIVHCACGLVPKDLEGSIVSNEYAVLAAAKGYSVHFLEYFSQQSIVSSSFLKCSIGIVIEKMLFKLPDWFKQEFFFPQFKEQKKIADCLRSIDNLIIAHTQKLKTLKAHKKALTQQLFPAEGETVPKRRFPGFKKNWKLVELDELGNLISGLTYSPKDIRDDGLLVLRSSNVQDGEIALDNNVFVRPDIQGANLSQSGDILICVRNGSKALIGKSAIIPDGLSKSTHGAFMTTFRSSASDFVFQLFQSPEYSRQVTSDLGATINSINGKRLKKYKFYIPPSKDEQNEIAIFLGSIDKLIGLERKKVESLKAHKKFLIQKLFPSIDEK